MEKFAWQVGKLFRQQTYPRPLPAVICAFLWNVPLTLALEVVLRVLLLLTVLRERPPTDWYGKLPLLLRQFPVPPMPGFRHQQPSWGLGPSQSQHNHTIGFRESKTLYHHLIHASSGTFCDFPFYNQPFYQRLFAKDRKQPAWASRTYVGRSRNIWIRRDYVHIPSPNRLISLTVLYEPFF